MRVTLALVIALAGGSASAQDWIVQRDAQGGVGATACAPGGQGGAVTAFCLTLGCAAGTGPAATLSVSEGAPKDRVVAGVAVDGAPAGVLDFRPDPSGVTWLAPLDEQDVLVAALRAGSEASVRLDWKTGSLERALGLSGSDGAIGEVLAACSAGGEAPPSAAELGLDVGPRESEDPAGEAIADNAEFCGEGEAGVDPEFLRRADVDGDGVNDAILDYMGLTCDGARAFCGSGGCSQEVWLGDPSGPYRLLVEGLIEAILLPAPGAVTLRLDGGACGRAGAEECEQTYRIEDGQLVPQP